MKGYSAVLLCLAIIPFVGCTTEEGSSAAGSPAAAAPAGAPGAPAASGSGDSAAAPVSTPAPNPASPISPIPGVPDPSLDKLKLKDILDYLYGVSKVEGFPEEVEKTTFKPLIDKFALGQDYEELKDALAGSLLQTARLREFLLKPSKITDESVDVPGDAESISIKTVFKLFPLLQTELSDFSTQSAKWTKELSTFDHTPLITKVNMGGPAMWLKEHGFTDSDISETALILDALDKVQILIAPTGSFNKVLRFYTIVSMLTPYDVSHAVLSLYMLTSPLRTHPSIEQKLETSAEYLFSDKATEVMEMLKKLATVAATLVDVVIEHEDVTGSDSVFKAVFDLERFVKDQGANYFTHVGKLSKETLPQLKEMEMTLHSKRGKHDEQTTFLREKGFTVTSTVTVAQVVEKIHELSSDDGPVNKLVELLKSVTPSGDGSSFSPIGLSVILTCVIAMLA